MGYFCFFGAKKVNMLLLVYRLGWRVSSRICIFYVMNIKLKLLCWVHCCVECTGKVHAQASTNFTVGYANKFDIRYIMGQIIELPLDKLWDKSIYSSGLILGLYQVHRNFKSQFYITSQIRDFFLTTKHLKERKELVFPTIKD